MTVHLSAVIPRGCLLLGALSILTACGGDGGSATASTETTATTAASSTTAVPPSSSTSTRSTLEPGSACPPPPMPADASDVTTATGDFDGDGSDDTFLAYRTGPDDEPEWHLRIERAHGEAADTVIPRDFGRAVGIGATSVVGAADVNGDGTDEAWAKVGGTATGSLVSLFSLSGCAVEAVTADGVPVVFAVGGATESIAGVECRDIDGNGALDFVAKLEAKSSDGTNYQTTDTEFVLAGGGFGVLSQAPGSATAGDADLARFREFHCGDLSLDS